MDEPFAALDYFTREQMQKGLLRVRQKQRCNILFVIHSIDEVLLLGHKIVVIESGLVKTQVQMPELEGDRNLLDEMLVSPRRHMIKSLNTADRDQKMRTCSMAGDTQQDTQQQQKTG